MDRAWTGSNEMNEHRHRSCELAVGMTRADHAIDSRVMAVCQVVLKSLSADRWLLLAFEVLETRCISPTMKSTNTDKSFSTVRFEGFLMYIKQIRSAKYSGRPLKLCTNRAGKVLAFRAVFSLEPRAVHPQDHRIRLSLQAT